MWTTHPRHQSGRVSSLTYKTKTSIHDPSAPDDPVVRASIHQHLQDSRCFQNLGGVVGRPSCLLRSRQERPGKVTQSLVDFTGSQSFARTFHSFGASVPNTCRGTVLPTCGRPRGLRQDYRASQTGVCVPAEEEGTWTNFHPPEMEASFHFHDSSDIIEFTH